MRSMGGSHQAGGTGGAVGERARGNAADAIEVHVDSVPWPRDPVVHSVAAHAENPPVRAWACEQRRPRRRDFAEIAPE